MGKITVDLIRKRAEHNEGMLANLEELALHQQHLEKIEVLHKVCRHLKILLLQNNLIHKLGNLHRLKELQYLNLAINNISKVQNLQRCESLTKLDLTMNFVPKQGLLTLATLNENVHLEELYLLGNPCADWPGYRQYVAAALPRLKKLDGKEIKHSERISAQQRARGKHDRTTRRPGTLNNAQALPKLHAQLCAELRAEGVDVEEASKAEDDGLDYDSDMEVEEPGFVDSDGEFKRPWCPATRILEHRENEAIELAQQEQRKAGQSHLFSKSGNEKVRRVDFPDIHDNQGRVLQKNEGQWEYTLDETEDCASLLLDVGVGKFLDTSLIKLQLPCEVKPDFSSAQRSKVTGSLLLTMPKERPGDRTLDICLIRRNDKRKAASVQRSVPSPTSTTAPKVSQISEHAKLPGAGKCVSIGDIVPRQKAAEDQFIIKQVRKAQLQFDDDDESIPPLC